MYSYNIYISYIRYIYIYTKLWGERERKKNKGEHQREKRKMALTAIGCWLSFLPAIVAAAVSFAVAVGYKHAFPCNKCVAALDRT